MFFNAGGNDALTSASGKRLNHSYGNTNQPSPGHAQASPSFVSAPEPQYQPVAIPHGPDTGPAALHGESPALSSSHHFPNAHHVGS